MDPRTNYIWTHILPLQPTFVYNFCCYSPPAAFTEHHHSKFQTSYASSLSQVNRNRRNESIQFEEPCVIFPSKVDYRSHAITQAVSRRLPGSRHVGFVVDKVALGPVFSEYFCFPCQFSFHRLLHVHRLSSRDGTIGQLVADVPSGLSLTPHQETKKTKQSWTITGRSSYLVVNPQAGGWPRVVSVTTYSKYEYVRSCFPHMIDPT
jgi:hypothetical protein